MEHALLGGVIVHVFYMVREEIVGYDETIVIFRVSDYVNIVWITRGDDADRAT